MSVRNNPIRNKIPVNWLILLTDKYRSIFLMGNYKVLQLYSVNGNDNI